MKNTKHTENYAEHLARLDGFETKITQTPGHWNAVIADAPKTGSIRHRTIEVRVGGLRIADCVMNNRHKGLSYRPEEQANAHLIAAAPELLAKLERVVAIFDSREAGTNVDGKWMGIPDWEEVDELRATIAKARNVRKA